MLAWDDRSVHTNTFTTYIEFTSTGSFAKASWLRNFTQSLTALPMLFRRFYNACLWRSLNSFYNDVSVFLFFFFQGSLKDRPSDRVRGCGTAQFGLTRTITHNRQNPAQYWKISWKFKLNQVFLLTSKISRKLLGYLPSKTNEKSIAFSSNSSGAYKNNKALSIARAVLGTSTYTSSIVSSCSAPWDTGVLLILFVAIVLQIINQSCLPVYDKLRHMALLRN